MGATKLPLVISTILQKREVLSLMGVNYGGKFILNIILREH